MHYRKLFNETQKIYAGALRKENLLFIVCTFRDYQQHFSRFLDNPAIKKAMIENRVKKWKLLEDLKSISKGFVCIYPGRRMIKHLNADQIKEILSEIGDGETLFSDLLEKKRTSFFELI